MKPLNLVGHQRPIQKVLFTWTGELLFSCCQGGELCAWDPEDGKLLKRYKFCVNGENVQKTISGLDVNFTGSHLIAASAEGLFVFDVVSGNQLLHLPLGEAVCRSVELNKKPDNQSRVVVARDAFPPNPCAILVVDFHVPLCMPDQQSLEAYPSFALEITEFSAKAVGVSWGIYDETLISWHDDGMMYIWDAMTGKKIQEVQMFDERVTCVDFSKDRTLCLCSSSDHTARLLCTQDLSVIQTYTTDRPLNACCISPLFDRSDDSKKMHIIVGGGQSKEKVTTTKAQEGKQEAIIMNLVTGETLGLIGGHFSPINSMAFKIDGSGFATGAEEGNCLTDLLKSAMIREAEEHLKSASKALKTNSWTFKFHPDYDMAALEYVEAAQCFQSAGEHKRCIEAFRAGAEARQKNGDFFGAGRLFENAATNSINFCSDLENGCKFLRSAAECYLVAGKGESAARVWLKIIQIADHKLKDAALVIEAYDKCCDIYESYDRDHMLVDVLKDYSGYLVRNIAGTNELREVTNVLRCYDNLLKLQLKLKQHQSYSKTVLCKVLIRLNCRDHVGASQELEAGIHANPAMSDSKEVQQADLLLKAWHEDPEIAKIAKHIQAPATCNDKPKSTLNLATPHDNVLKYKGELSADDDEGFDPTELLL